MADMQHQRGGRVRLQNFLGENAPRPPWIYVVTHAVVIQPP